MEGIGFGISWQLYLPLKLILCRCFFVQWAVVKAETQTGPSVQRLSVKFSATKDTSASAPDPGSETTERERVVEGV